MILTTDEVYFLVRTGVWGQAELEEWCQQRMVEHQDDTYDLGHNEGYREGFVDGKNELEYKRYGR